MRRQVLRAKQRRPEQQTGRARASAIIARRSELVAEIERLRRAGAASRFLENAQHLLTIWWSKSDWAAREQLLKSAGWLLALASVAP